MDGTDTLDSRETAPTKHSAGRWWALPVVGLVVTFGVWVTGGLATDDEQVARVLTGLWFGASGLVAAAVAWRHRWLAAPVMAGYLLVAVGLGGFLAYSSTVDQVVDEDVVVAAPVPTTSNGSAAPQQDGQQRDEAERENVLLARGDFAAQAHPTAGIASVIQTPKGSVLTLTEFETDPGPDLRVYLVAAGASGVDGGTDLGAMKGNKGDQQYEVPDVAARGDLSGTRVVIWCRAFSVAFGSARLA
jgi:hypothetical protein